jgi:hypothetical protein
MSLVSAARQKPLRDCHLSNSYAGLGRSTTTFDNIFIAFQNISEHFRTFPLKLPVWHNTKLHAVWVACAGHDAKNLAISPVAPVARFSVIRRKSA